MKGVEKGYRLYREDTPCEPFEIEVAPVTLPGNQLSTYDVEYSGNPTFNVTATVEVVYCPPPGGCNGGSQVFLPSESGSPLQVVFHCRNIDDPITMTFRTKLTDIDSVETEWVNHEVTCLAASPGAVSATPQPGVPGSG